MNDQEFIRKAVELADRWTCEEYASTDGLAYLDTINGACWRAHDDEEWPLDELPQIILDALAAQLVRQCDQALCSLDWGHLSKPFYKTNGPDRTMNTIRAIVDSSVLTTGGSSNV